MASSFAARVTQINRESLTRQVREGVLIRRTSKDIMNSKFEWFQPPTYEIWRKKVREWDLWAWVGWLQ